MPQDEPNESPIWLRLLIAYVASLFGISLAVGGLGWMYTGAVLPGLVVSAGGTCWTWQGIRELIRCYRSVE